MADRPSLPVVLVSGWSMPVTLLDGVIGAGAEVHTLVPGEPALSPEQQPGDWLARVLPALPEPALWVGWSLGGQLAMEVARHWPQRVAAVVTIASTPCFVAAPDWPVGMPEARFGAFRDQLCSSASATVAHFQKLMVQGDERLREVRRALRAHPAGSGLDGSTLATTLQWLGELDQRRLWRESPVPAWHLYGGRDPLVSAQTPWSLGLDRQRWQMIEGMAHWPAGPRADEIRLLIDEFRKQLT